ncbi:MAG: cellulase family glycosylhydrolase [Ignavibacteria bacterium]|nr:cellulase family glycosylhydrolase [Ignavibacteria bacterium]
MIRKMLFILLLVLSPNLYSQPIEKINLVISYPSQPVAQFKGFGAEWDSRAYDLSGVTDEDFKLIGERLKWMKIPIVRIMMQTKWCYSKSLGYDWENRDMQLLYRHLNFCQQNGIEVILSDWGIEVDWLAVDGIEKMDNPLYAEVIGTYLDYLINKKGFTCIKYFGLVNEPNYEVGNFERWRAGAENVFQILKDKELDKKVKFIGPGQSNDNEWFFNTVDEARYMFDVYDVHMYAWKDRTAKGSVQTDLTQLWNYAKSIDPKANQKLYFVTEAGMRDGQSAAISTQINSFYYGVFMADFAIQAIHSGANAVLAWMLDDNSHPDFQWGLWTDKKNGMKLRPWFYSWSLLTKLFPDGSDVYKIRSRSINVRALGTKITTNGKTDWSFSIVNINSNPVKIFLKVDNEGEYNFKQYVYAENEMKSDVNGFPLPLNLIKAKLSDGIEFEIKPQSVVFITTLQ